MTKNLALAAFLAGLLAVAWVGAGYVGTNPLALTVTAIIGAVYALGSLEMLRFRQATSGLAAALEAIPHDLARLDDWLAQVPPSLRGPVRLRVEGERIALPGPALTPYLAALLVMLGMLGTFLGMVVTLNGAVIALESTTDLATIRAALAAPIKGLGLAFGTSVAGVAASAMLGLVSALCRRERQQAAQRLDARIATTLRAFSHARQREATYQAIQAQAQALPEVVDKLGALMDAMERQSAQLHERLLAGQDDLLRDVRGIHVDLASSVDRSLQAGLTQGVRAAGEAIAPLVAETMQGLARETASLHQRTADTVQAQLDGLAKRFDTTVTGAASAWTDALARQERTGEALADGLRSTLTAFTETFAQRSAALLATLEEELASRDRERLAAVAQSMESLAASLQREWQQAGAQTLAQQQQICTTLERTARDTIGEIAGLMQAAAEAPRAAAEVIAALREELSRSVVRDNELLEERGRIMATLNALLDAVNHATTEQRGAIDALVASAAAMLDGAGGRFAEQVDAGSARMADTAAQVTAGAVEMSSLGEAFGVAVRLFGDANDKLVGNLQRIEAALERSTARSDEQLAYYVAQAREVIDLSLLAQKQIMDELHRLPGRKSPVAGEVC